MTAGVTLEQLYRTQYLPMLRTATLIVRSREVAEDIVHDAFVGVSMRLPTLLNPEGYLRTTVVNGCRSHLRRRSPVERLTRLPQEHDRQTGSELDDVLARLPARQRVAVVLRFYLSMTDREMAEALGCRPSTARSLVHRAIENLRKELS